MTTSKLQSPISGQIPQQVAPPAQAQDYEHYPSPVALFDATGTLVYANRSAPDGPAESWLTRVPRGTHLSDLARAAGFEDRELAETRAGIAEVIAGNRDRFVLEYSIESGGGERWYRVVVTPTAEFAPRGALVLNHDLTESRRTEERLRASQERLDLALWGTGLGLWEWQVESGEMNLGNRWLEMLGYEREEIEPQIEKVHMLVHPTDRERMVHAIDAHLVGRTEVYQDEHRIQCKDGSWKWVLDRGLVVERTASGEPVRASGITLDITDRKALEARLNQANKMEAVGRLAGGVAHDFNNLLTAINGYADLVLSQLETDDPTVSHIRAIKRSGERAASLTSRLLAFSRRQILQPRILDLNRVVRNIRKLLQPMIGEDINLIQQLDSELRPVKADLGQMEQVIMNLAVNARDAMPDGGDLTLETRNVEVSPEEAARLPGFRPGSYVMLAVSDTGSGMDEKTKLRVFEPFFTTKPAGQGTGLGLSMVYGIVKQSDGYTDIISGPGEGTSVKIFLPPVAAGSAMELISPEEEPVREVPEGSESVLLCEDEGAVRQLVRAVLKDKGYDVVEAGSAEEAIELFEESPKSFDLLVTDVVLPGMNGDELARNLQRRLENLKVLLISGYPRGSIGMQHKLPSDTQFLQKPFSPSILCERVREILDQD
jgi:PAS domain S-box-containing protein